MLFLSALNLHFEILVFLKMCTRVPDSTFTCNYRVDSSTTLFLVIYRRLCAGEVECLLDGDLVHFSTFG